MSPADPLRIVLVSTARDWHGGELQGHLLARGLRSAGHECLILARNGGQFAARLAVDGFDVATFSGRGRSPQALWNIRRYLRRVRAEVLHLNDAHGILCAGVAAVGLPIAARVVARRVDFPIRSTWPYRRLCDRVICVSHGVAAVCRAAGLPDAALRVVHDGVDPSRLTIGDRLRGRRSLSLDPSQRLILVVANLTDHKGHSYLLQALPRILRHFPEARVALAGDGQLRQELEQQARQFDLSTVVHFLGYRDDVPDLIAACDVFVLPSHLEGLGSSLIDGMLMQRPIVTTYAGGIPELVGPAGSDGPVARLVPPRDPEALAAAVIETWSSPEQSQRLAASAYARAQRLFTAPVMVANTLAIYREVMGQRAAREAA